MMTEVGIVWQPGSLPQPWACIDQPELLAASGIGLEGGRPVTSGYSRWGTAKEREILGWRALGSLGEEVRRAQEAGVGFPSEDGQWVKVVHTLEGAAPSDHQRAPKYSPCSLSSGPGEAAGVAIMGGGWAVV